jgi:hypothetical protein
MTFWKLDLVVQCLRLALSKGPNWVGVSPSHLRPETDPVFETCFLISILLDNGQSPTTQWFWELNEVKFVQTLCHHQSSILVNNIPVAGFEVLTAVTVKSTDIWAVMLCNSENIPMLWKSISHPVWGSKSSTCCHNPEDHIWTVATSKTWKLI